ncbi:hypothetical protein A9Q84_12890 [Halobacteriovorax marinus]|uniref:Outer membrane protein beta-barrel domain-containing protein n=1 Tax=Halobacteriovorax marinus TaxID=97084 RepID=A0A1Y5F8G7_9BACT|nr:hypothetical protein A9Q84_12890 [Halobacteriovorax marinus]
MKKILSIFLVFLSLNSYSLELDEKLTVRVLGLSSSKKTLLTNRGLEDGLVVGDHAKFFLSTGVVARGVVIKASPSRSIWSVYRVIDAAKIFNDRVMNIKIASPVKLTEDPSRALKADDMSSTIPVMSRGRSENVPQVSTDEQRDLDSMLEEQAPVIMGGTSKKTLEVFGVLSLNSMSGSFEQGSESGDSSAGHVDFTLGFEKYFATVGSFFENISIFALISKRSSTSGTTVTTKSDWFEYGIGGNWHFYNKPLTYNRPIGFVTLAAGVGTATSETTVNTSSTASTDPLKGSSNFFLIGVGGKYYLKNGFGVRAVIDYFSSGSTFEFDGGENLTQSLSGIRMRAGLSYRF